MYVPFSRVAKASLLTRPPYCGNLTPKLIKPIIIKGLNCGLASKCLRSFKEQTIL